MDRSRLKPTSGGRGINYLKFIAALRPLPGSRLFSKPSRSNAYRKRKRASGPSDERLATQVNIPGNLRNWH